MTGEVYRMVVERGFGFLIGEDGGNYFFHARSMVPGPEVFNRCIPGTRVSFTPTASGPGGGLRAEQVEIADGE